MTDYLNKRSSMKRWCTNLDQRAEALGDVVEEHSGNLVCLGSFEHRLEGKQKNEK